MIPIRLSRVPRRAPVRPAWIVADLTEATAAALTLTMRESPIVGVVSSGITAAEPRQDGRSAAHPTVRETRYEQEGQGRRRARSR
jgi:hypothetical protein